MVKNVAKRTASLLLVFLLVVSLLPADIAFAAEEKAPLDGFSKLEESPFPNDPAESIPPEEEKAPKDTADLDSPSSEKNPDSDSEFDEPIQNTVAVSASLQAVGGTPFLVGGMRYDLAGAISAAQGGSDKVIVVAEDCTITESFEIPQGVTLLVPFDAGNTCYKEKPEYTDKADPTCYRKLTLAENVLVTVKGSISVGSKHLAASAGSCCKPTGPYGWIYMESSSSIEIEDGGKVYAWGYITGSGSVEAKSGAEVYEYFQITDWRGGTATSGMRSGGVFPFSQYYIQNIEVKLTICHGAAEKAFLQFDASKSKFPNTITIASKEQNSLFVLAEGSKFIKQYLADIDCMRYEVIGAISIGSVSLSFNVGCAITISSEKYVLPINGNTRLVVRGGSTFHVSNDTAILPCVEILIENGGEMVVDSGKNLYVYDVAEWKNAYIYQAGTASGVPVNYTPTTCGKRPTPTSARIDVNGTLTASGSIYTTNSGADIFSSDGTGVFNQAGNVGTKTTTQQATQNETTISRENITITPAKLHNDTTYYSGDLAYTETATAESGDTIDYILGMWGGTPATVTFNANGGTGTMEAQQITSFNTPLDACTFTRLGYTFAGWNTSSDGTGTKYDNLQEISPKSGDSLILYAQWTVNTYTITVKSDANGSSIADVSLDGPGTGYKITEWGSDKQITIIAPEKQGFTFKGWYKEAESYDGNSLSPDLVVKKSLTDLLAAGMADDKNVISLVAVYEPKTAENPTKLTLNKAPDGVKVSWGGQDQQPSTDGAWSVPVGTEVTITVNDPNFRYWTNANDKVMSREKTYKFTMVTNTTLTAETSADSAFVIFQSADGRLLSAQSNLNSLTLPAAPYRVGYTFKGWKVNGSAAAATTELDTLKTNINSLSSNGTVTVTAAYNEITAGGLSVTVYVDGTKNEGMSKSSISLGEIAAFTAPAESGDKTFRFWASDAKGTNILSFSTTYSIRVTKNIEIYAIYGGENKPKVQPVVRVDNVLAGNESNVNSLTFMIGASIPDGYTLVEMGALYAKDLSDDVSADERLRVEKVDNNTVRKAVSRLNHETAPKLADFSYALGFKISEKNASSTICLRGYVAVKDSTGTIYYYYSGVRLASYNNPNETTG